MPKGLQVVVIGCAICRYALRGRLGPDASIDQEKVLPTRAKMDRVSRARTVATPSHASGASLEELLAFERLLSDLSARFANVAVDQVIAEIESALKQLLKFLGFDRSAFWEFVDDEKQNFLCSVAVEGVEPPLPGPIPDEPSLFDQTKTSHRKESPQRNTIAALVFVPCL
jgi:hypothetical protein